MITSLIEMVKLLYFDHMTTSTIQFEPRDKILSMKSWTEAMAL